MFLGVSFTGLVVMKSNWKQFEYHASSKLRAVTVQLTNQLGSSLVTTSGAYLVVHYKLEGTHS